MPRSRFQVSLPFILRWEGGYVNHPDDPGGATNRGVTQKVYDRWRRDEGLEARDVRELTDAELEDIYESGYWFPPKCHELAEALDLVQFDTAVNMGTRRAVKTLQSSVGCTADGIYGPMTARAVAQCDAGTALMKYCDERDGFYRRLATQRPRLAIFLKGWLNRLNALRAEVGLPGFESLRDNVDFGDAAYIKRIPDLGDDPDFDI